VPCKPSSTHKVAHLLLIGLANGRGEALVQGHAEREGDVGAVHSKAWSRPKSFVRAAAGARRDWSITLHTVKGPVELNHQSWRLASGCAAEGSPVGLEGDGCCGTLRKGRYGVTDLSAREACSIGNAKAHFHFFPQLDGPAQAAYSRRCDVADEVASHRRQAHVGCQPPRSRHSQQAAGSSLTRRAPG
jgi:hypothetical protein